MVTVRMVEKVLERELRTMVRQQLLKQIRRLTEGEKSGVERACSKSPRSVSIMPARENLIASLPEAHRE